MRSTENYFSSRQLVLFLLIALMLSVSAGTASAQTSTFTYQGRLTDGGTPANGNYDLQFALWDSSSGGAQIGSTQTVNTVAVSAGIFTVTLDFGANAFPGANRFLEIGARLSGASSFTQLTPRQPITSTPYAVRSGNATTADTATNATQLGGVGASQFVQTTDSRLTDARSPTANSANYIQNATNQQASSNFSISGNGTAGGTLSASLVNAMTQYNIGGSRVLSVDFIKGSLFAGFGAGGANTTGGGNTLVGDGAGGSDTTGAGNSFFGDAAGADNATGSYNSFFGNGSGNHNNADDNSFFGFGAGLLNTTGTKNSFFGSQAGNVNTTGTSNTLLGDSADVGSGNLDHATAIGANAVVSQSNSLVLGSVSGAGTKVGIGTSAPTDRLTVQTATDRYGFVHSDGTITVGSYVGGSTNGGWYGTKSNHPLSFFVNNGGPSMTITTSGNVIITALGSAGSTTLCRNAANEISTCASSLRYKKDFTPFAGGLDVVARLRPITFSWRDHPERDLGLAAEDVAKIEPLLVTHNANGEIEGVKYDHLNVVLINAIKQQQTQIETLRTANAALSARLRSVEKNLNKKVSLARVLLRRRTVR